MDLLDDIKKAGVVGAGGAGFPTHVKLDCKVDYLLINGAECEPLLQTDKYIMNNYADEIIAAARAASYRVAAKETYLAVKGVNEKELSSVREAAARSRDKRIKVFPLGNYYPAGDEQLLVYDVTGRLVPPSGIPLDVGAVVVNAATMLNISDAMAGVAVTHKFLTVTGLVRQPKILRVPIGISFRECLLACGGPEPERFSIVDGGPMMGKVTKGEDWDKRFVTKTTSGIIVVPDGNNFIARQRDASLQKILNRAKSACIQCSFCTDLCPRRLIGHKLRPHMVMRQMAARDFGAPPEKNKILEEALICCECGICETFACPMGLSPRQVNIYVKKALAGTAYQRGGEPLEVSELRKYRMLAPSKIMSRMGLAELYGHKAEVFENIETAEIVRIPLKQHIGAAALPVVTVGDETERGQLIAAAAGKISANVHSSLSGTVTAVGAEIEIRRAR